MPGRRWIVDGMNVVGARPDGWWRDRRAAMDRLVEQLRLLVDATGDTITVVFDGRPFDLPSNAGGPHVMFASRTGRDAADDRIVELVGCDTDPSTLVVVSSDRELTSRVRARGAEVVTAGAFLRRLEAVP